MGSNSAIFFIVFLHKRSQLLKKKKLFPWKHSFTFKAKPFSEKLAAFHPPEGVLQYSYTDSCAKICSRNHDGSSTVSELS